MSKERYNKYVSSFDDKKLKEDNRELFFVFDTIRELHTKVSTDIKPDELISYFWAKYPDSDKTIYGLLLDKIVNVDISEIAFDAILTEIAARKIALKLAQEAFKRAQGQITQTALQQVFEDEFDKVDHSTADLPINEVNLDLEELIQHAYAEQGYRWRLDCLNKSLGSLRAGDFGFIFARPETGKTTFLTSEVTHFLSTFDRPIVWFNNEEQGGKVGLRLLQAYFGVSLDVLLASPRRFRDQYKAEVGANLHLFDGAIIDRRDVETIVKKLQPGLVIYDQITKIKGFKADRQDLMLGDICQWARELAKGNHAAIGVSQADGTAEGVRYLTMEHVANAKTAMQAEADFILGIGKTHEQDAQYVRYLNISKNKLFGDKDSIADLRHGRFEVIIEPTIARYKDVIKFD